MFMENKFVYFISFTSFTLNKINILNSFVRWVLLLSKWDTSIQLIPL